MPSGKVKWFNEIKGYGIIRQESGQELYFHYKSIISNGYRWLEEGTKVKFDVIKGKKGLEAVNIYSIKNQQ